MGRSADAYPVEFVDEPPPPTFGDAVRYLWERRARLAKYFLGLLAVGVVGTLVWSFARERVAEATLSLSHSTVAGPGGTGRTWPSRILRDMIATPTGSTVVLIPERRTP